MSTLKDLIVKASEIYGSIPYQAIADSPSIRYYTNWSKFDKYTPSSEAYPCEIENIDNAIRNKYNIVFAGGCVSYNDLQDGIDIKVLSRRDVLSNADSSVRAELFSMFNINDSKIYAVHVAGFSIGVILYINKSLDKPLKIGVGGGSYGGHLSQHLFIALKEGLEAKIQIEYFNSYRSMRTFIVEGIVGINSILEISNIVKESDKAPNFISGHFMVNDNSELTIGTSAIAGDMLRIQNIVKIPGRSARHRSIGSVIGTGKNSVYYIEKSSIIGRESRSIINVRGIASDSAKTAVHGYAIQEEQSFNSGTSVDVSTLTIGKGALAVTIPMLEVRCGDVVEARHAASQAILEQDLLTYLRTRGLTIPEAIKMMVYDYIVEGFQELPSWMQKYLIENLYSELDKVNFEELKI